MSHYVISMLDMDLLTPDRSEVVSSKLLGLTSVDGSWQLSYAIYGFRWKCITLQLNAYYCIS